MKKRVLAGLLWFYCTWYAWSLVASFTGVSDLAGPIIGLVAAMLFSVDPLGRIWTATQPLLTPSESRALTEPG